MSRHRPLEFFTVSFLDVVTSTGGVFLLLVLVFFAALYLNAAMGRQGERAVLFTRGLELRGMLQDMEKERAQATARVDSLSTLIVAAQEQARREETARNSSTRRAELESLRAQSDGLQAQVNELRRTAAQLEEPLVGLSAKTPQAARLRYLRPAVLPTESKAQWQLLCVVHNDSLYGTNGQHGDNRQFIWTDSLMLCRPRHGSGDPVEGAVVPRSQFDRWLDGASKEGDVIELTLYPESAESYPVLRDFLLTKKRRISLRLVTGDPEVRFSSTHGWNPSPIY